MALIPIVFTVSQGIVVMTCGTSDCLMNLKTGLTSLFGERNLRPEGQVTLPGWILLLEFPLYRR